MHHLYVRHSAIWCQYFHCVWESETNVTPHMGSTRTSSVIFFIGFESLFVLASHLSDLSGESELSVEQVEFDACG